VEWTVHLDLAQGYIVAEQWGAFTLNEQFSFLRAILLSPYWKPGMPLLIKYLRLEIGNIDTNALEEIASDLGRLIGKISASRIALLAGNDLQYGLGLGFKTLSESFVNGEVKVFREEPAAIEWLIS
jgi:hypothetical protein